ncbi:MAG: hypothetical protein WBK91_04115 [Alphaproteobacteria bacterium]
MILSANQISRFTPDKYAGKDNAPVYLVKAASQMEKMQWRRDCSLAGARFSSDAILFEEIRSGIETIIEPQERPELLELLDQQQAGNTDGFTDQEKKTWLVLLQTLFDLHQPYREIQVARDYALEVMAYHAARRFLVGWENVPGEFKRQNGLVTDVALENIDDGDIQQIGWHAVTMNSVSKDQTKNSGSPLPLPKSQLPLPVADEAQTAATGNSSESATAKTQD